MWYILGLLLLSGLIAQERDSVYLEIEENLDIINEYSARLGVQSRIVASVICAERSLNYNWQDTYLDRIMAVNRLNSSVGFCQIKVNTAKWLEDKLNDASSPYYLGDSVATLFPRSVYLDKLVERLEDDELSIMYAAAYLAMFQKRWLREGVNISNRPDILGSLYSLGAYKTNGAEHLPHPDPVPNEFGLLAQYFYDSDFSNRLFGQIAE
jgi:hypothetical protein